MDDMHNIPRTKRAATAARKAQPISASGKLKRIVETLGFTEHNTIKLCSGGGQLRHDFDINPDDFLQMAEDSYGRGALPQALTDAKRAIHCQIDQALLALGYSLEERGMKWKLSLMTRCGFVAPRIMKKVSDARNLLEHEYRAPTKRRVEEALDIAALFVGATRRHLDYFEHEFCVGKKSEQIDDFDCSSELSFHYDEDKHYYHVIACENILPNTYGHRSDIMGKIKVDAKDDLFPLLVKLTVAGDHEGKVKQALQEFFAALAK